jgi:hypothetical protein
MEFISKIGDIVLLENNESLVVVDCIEYQEEAYLKLGNVLIEENNEQYLSGFVKEVIEDDGTYKLALVDNLETINALEKIIEDVHNKI